MLISQFRKTAEGGLARMFQAQLEAIHLGQASSSMSQATAFTQTWSPLCQSHHAQEPSRGQLLPSRPCSGLAGNAGRAAWAGRRQGLCGIPLFRRIQTPMQVPVRPCAAGQGLQQATQTSLQTLSLHFWER